MGMKVNGTSGLTFPDTTTLASAGQASVRAWVNFNGTGTVAIRAAYNVTSITDNSTGNYTLNFTTALPDANYAITGSGGAGAASNQLSFIGPFSANPTPSAVRLVSLSDAGISQDTIFCSVAVFR
jgi:hypothetical protein